MPQHAELLLRFLQALQLWALCWVLVETSEVQKHAFCVVTCKFVSLALHSQLLCMHASHSLNTTHTYIHSFTIATHFLMKKSQQLIASSMPAWSA